ncbi:alpha/beta hydrolase [Aliikangiella coralliicola]|uniref:Alpha/beta hydrolase n=1 Tax=Aliikangiella coralliicola TaxID=2592383 RepID=A0A545UJE5_9GAMM|nr:alpha/beta hydrolase [Aliikangiella coralliicola]TQV89588.1 alpha/beta hydrolase [Aliikangiella coralliicola]
MKFLTLVLTITIFFSSSTNAESIILSDEHRGRNIPIEIYYPDDKTSCTKNRPCPVVLLSAGYGVSHTKYTFLTELLTHMGYLTVSISHEITTDPPLSVEGNLFETRSENWIRGSATLEFVQKNLRTQMPSYDFSQITLIGHSNGGDISAWLGNENKSYVKKIITLDHRRVPLPKRKHIGVLSIRASDFSADKGVLPSENEQVKFSSCVVAIPKSRHNDMSDYGPAWLKQKISSIVSLYLKHSNCNSLQNSI